MDYKSMILAAFFLVGGIASSNAQDIAKKNVPVAVKTAFSKAYPKASDADWKMEGSNYKVDFDLAKTDYKVTYTATGKTIAVEKDIPNTQLPAVIAKSIQTRYPKGRIDDADWINTGGKITYKIDIEGTPDVKVWYGADGEFIKEVAD
jgi:uncharacterized membrane protein YkoI